MWTIRKENAISFRAIEKWKKYHRKHCCTNMAEVPVLFYCTSSVRSGRMSRYRRRVYTGLRTCIQNRWPPWYMLTIHYINNQRHCLHADSHITISIITNTLQTEQLSIYCALLYSLFHNQMQQKYHTQTHTGTHIYFSARERCKGCSTPTVPNVQ